MLGRFDGLYRFPGARQYRRCDTCAADDRHHLALRQPRRVQFDYKFRYARNADGLFSSQRARHGSGRADGAESGSQRSLNSGGSSMKEPSKEARLEAAVVTDRGLSEKRPLNEDSFLADEKRGIFAV